MAVVLDFKLVSNPQLLMLYRRFGRTELQMPVFSCGGMRYQFKWEDVPNNEIPADNQANWKRLLEKQLRLGLIILKLLVVMALPKCN
jgi:hypothetical protein